MSAEQIVEACWWYLDHLYLFLIPMAVFDIVCWMAIAIYVKRRRAGRSTPATSPVASSHRIGAGRA